MSVDFYLLSLIPDAITGDGINIYYKVVRYTGGGYNLCYVNDNKENFIDVGIRRNYIAEDLSDIMTELLKDLVYIYKESGSLLNYDNIISKLSAHRRIQFEGIDDL